MVADGLHCLWQRRELSCLQNATNLDTLLAAASKNCVKTNPTTSDMTELPFWKAVMSKICAEQHKSGSCLQTTSTSKDVLSLSREPAFCLIALVATSIHAMNITAIK